MYKTLFQNIQETIINTIDGAQDEVVAAVAWFTDREIYRALWDATERKVKVFLIFQDDDINWQSGLDYEALANKGATVYAYSQGTGILHHKFCIVDRRIVIIGTYNWTYRAATYNQESVIVFDGDDAPVGDFLAEFEKLRSSSNVNVLGTTSSALSDSTSLAESGLKKKLLTEIRLLEAEIAALEGEKTDIEHKLAEFERTSRSHLGDLLLKFWELQKLLAKLKAKLTMKREDEEHAHQTEQKYNQTFEEVSEARSQQAPELAEKDEQDLKKMYREAVLMAHPDFFADDPEREAQAHRIMQRLNDAYKNKDIDTVREIWEALKTGTAFSLRLDEIDDIEKLEKILEKLRKRKQELTAEIARIKQSDSFLVLESGEDLDTYFDQARTQLELKIGILEKELQQHQKPHNP